MEYDDAATLGFPAIPLWLHPKIFQEAIILSSQGRGDRKTCLELCGGTKRLLSLDYNNAVYVVSLLSRTPQITSLKMGCNIERGAMGVIAEYLSQTTAIEKIVILGEVSIEQHDDGTLMQCLSEGMRSNSSVSEICFEKIDLSGQQNRQSLRCVLRNKRNLVKISFASECVLANLYDADIAYITNGLAAQENLREVEIVYPFGLSQAHLQQLLTNLSHHAPFLVRLVLCHSCLGTPVLPALTELIERRHLQELDIRGGGTGIFVNSSDDAVRDFCNKIMRNTSLHKIILPAGIPFHVWNKARILARRNKWIKIVQNTICTTLDWNLCQVMLLELICKEEIQVSCTPVWLALMTILPNSANCL